MSIIIFIVILAVLIFIHELGHFLFAKMFGIRVDEFALGFPPRLWSKKIGETRYAINAIPFGGYVKIFGENPDEESLNGPDASRSFVRKNRPIQSAVLVAGVLFNVLFAMILMTGAFMVGVPSSLAPEDVASAQDAKLLVAGVTLDSPAGEAGIMAGDQILFLQKEDDSIQLPSVTQMQDFITRHNGEEVTLLYKRDGEARVAIITPVDNETIGRPAIGVALNMVGVIKKPFFGAAVQSFKWSRDAVVATVQGLGSLIKNMAVGQADFSQVTGPVGIVGIVKDASHLGIIYLVTFTAFISLNLAVINLVPFPALDGGRLLFVLIESVRRKSISPRIANTLNVIGFALLILLMIAVTYHDILRLITK